MTRRSLGLVLAALLAVVSLSAWADQADITPAWPVGYGDMFAYDNVTATDIQTTDIYHAIHGIWSTGTSLAGVTYTAGSTGPISAYADYGATVTGTVLATDTAHGLTTGDYVTIVASTNYNGTFQITKVTDNTFYFTDTWVANDAAGQWIEGDYLTVAAAGVYRLDWSVAATSASASVENYHVEPVKNATDLDSGASEAQVDNGAGISSINAGCLVALAAGDRIWLKTKQSTTGTDDVTFSHGNLRLVRVGR